MTTCSACGEEAAKVIYLGLPMRLCLDGACSSLTGFWSFVAEWLPIVTEDEYGEPEFAFMVYEGAYLPALWCWLKDGSRAGAGL